jgi:leader peptidase (prepilin peptidase)/N-methyltransferase
VLVLHVLIFVIGLAVGSFLSAFTYRWPKSISILRGRSNCPKCKKKIVWYDNIPLLSFILLKGRCRRCSKKISFRYPLIELTTALSFSGIFYFSNHCPTAFKGTSLQGNVVCHWQDLLGPWVLPIFLLITSILIAVFVIDLENQLIPDELVFLALVVTFMSLLLSSSDKFYIFLLSGFSASSFLLLINLLTLGRGMGLGDVKFALFVGIFLGWPQTVSWMFLSFIIGAFIGIVLIITKKTKFGKPIPFGPFLVASFFITLFWGDFLTAFFFPYF